MNAAQPDEFKERARIAGESQDIAREYSEQFRASACTAFLLAVASFLLTYLFWQLTGSSSALPPTLVDAPF